MSIEFQAKERILHLKAEKCSYALQITPSGHLIHRYWGPRLDSELPEPPYKNYDRAFSPHLVGSDLRGILDMAKFEYPTYGNGDYRDPAIQLLFADGSTVCDLRYKSHSITKGKSALNGLPAVYVEKPEEAETLVIILEDALKKISVELSYSIFPGYNAITRSSRIINGGKESLEILKAASATLDLNPSNYELLQLSGSWARERHVERTALRPGVQGLSSARGASSHQHNPFIAVLEKGATETSGEVFAMNLVYSGNFSAEVEVDQDSMPRLSIGINPFDFRWHLESGESFQTPEAVLVYSSEGLGGMSRIFHKLYRERLCRGKYRDSDRFILINNWEATYFKFNEDLLVGIASEAKKLGVELFVLDDGWFGKRDSDNCSLGDWFADKAKLPDGISGLARKISAIGMKFGLWFEPEMVSPDSDLYRAHPDWCLHVEGRPRTEGRQQLILDYSRSCVRNYIVDVLSKVLGEAPISYIKWDMNRHMTEIGSADLPSSRQRETAHRYMLGLYEVLETLTSRFPNILFESCSGGGGRFDPGMLFYMPQVWASDNSDAISRLKIQYGTSLVYPVSAMGAHVSAVPNHQHHRVTSLEFRGLVSMSGNMGYELDVSKMTDEEKSGVKKQIETCSQIRHTVLHGDQYRLKSPFEGNETAWVFVSSDRKEAVAFYFYTLAEANTRPGWLKLAGLEPARKYRIESTGEIFNGDYLMKVGLMTPSRSSGDFKGAMWRLLAL